MSGRNQRNSDVSDEEMEVQATGYDTDEEGGLRVDDDIYIPPPPRKFSEVDVSGPRLMITKIVNENFKSYAGKQVVGPFHKCFSAIVGPNGSGKSNVIDSMLFVFGYRSSKIRSKKIASLIHNSSEHPNVNGCTVSVHFQRIIDKPGSDYEVVPNSEFVISRSAFKDNSSYYQHNNKKVQFKEIAKLLRSHGVDLDHNRFLILQGEVEQIAMMKPKAQTEYDTGMLEFLEDIIGTVRYKEPLEKLSMKVETLTERRAEKLNRLRVVEKEKDTLEQPMQKAIQYLKMENTIIKLQHHHYHCKRLEAAEQLAEKEEKRKDLDKDLADLMNEMKNIKEQKDEKNNLMKDKCKKWDKLQARKDEQTAEFDRIQKHDKSLHAELVETNKRRKANIATVKTEKTKLEELKAVPEKNAKDIEECERLVEKYTKDREKEEEALMKLMSGLKEKTEPLMKERSELEKNLITLRKDVDQAKATFDIAESELKLYTSVEQSEKEKLEKLKQTYEETVTTLREREEQLKSLEMKIPATQKSLNEAKSEFEQAKNREMEMTGKLRTLRDSFEEKRSSMQANKSRNRIIDSLMQEKNAGRIPGIFGRLGDLGAIDAKYDVAISTACGPLDNVVVDKVSTAEACITFLRRNDIGRTTLIPLEKQQRFLQHCRQRIETPENVPRLFDLIKVADERVLPAFYYALQDTLVAEDLDQATRIAYGRKRFRVVTLKGELIELSGTMSGGGRSVFKGRMGQKVVQEEIAPADIDKLQKELDQVYEECNRLRAKQQPLENQIHTLSASLRDMTVDRDKFSIQVKTLREQAPSLKSQLTAQEKKAKESVCDPKEVERLEKAVKCAKKDLEKVEEGSKGVENQVSKINQKIEEISGGRVKEQQKKITNLNKLIEKTKGEICRLQVAIKTAERNVKKTTQKIETLETNVHNDEQRLLDIQKEKTDLEETAKTVLDDLKQVNEALVERDELLASMKEELNELTTREGKMKALKIDLDQKVNDSNKVLKEIGQKIPDYTKRIAALKLRSIPNETVEDLKELSPDEVKELDPAVISANLQKAKERLPTEIPNMQIIADYQEKNALYLRRAADLEEITNERNKMRDIFESSRRRRAQEFSAGFDLITGKLKEMYQMITLGGDAELELVDSLDPFSEGIVFSVRPPKKSWKNISNLSGGEKTLSSLALVFALHHYKPTPLYFMDEIDAALDFKNVSIVGNYIKERTKNAQFIVISLRSNMFELADYLVGIYKTYNCTKSVTVHLEKYYEKNNIAPPTQITASRNLYSQQSRINSQSNFMSQHKENRAPSETRTIPATCPGGIESTRSPVPGSSNTFRFPDLAICPTPAKTPATSSSGNSNNTSNKQSPSPQQASNEERTRRTSLIEGKRPSPEKISTEAKKKAGGGSVARKSLRLESSNSRVVTTDSSGEESSTDGVNSTPSRGANKMNPQIVLTPIAEPQKNVSINASQIAPTLPPEASQKSSQSARSQKSRSMLRSKSPVIVLTPVINERRHKNKHHTPQQSPINSNRRSPRLSKQNSSEEDNDSVSKEPLSKKRKI